MTEWERLGEQYEVLKPWTDIGIRWATKYYVKMDDTDAYIVAMCKLSNRYLTALTANLNLQSSIPQDASRGFKVNGKFIISKARRKSS